MKLIIPTWLLCLLCLPTTLCAQSISKRGYPEHFFVGSLIAGGITRYVFKKTKKRRLAWVTGVFVATLAGFLKEVADSKLFGKFSNWNDFNYTVLGGIVGASLAVPLRKSRKVRSYPV